MNPELPISVIVPVYNAERWLSECLDSVLGQTLMPVEVIAVNDGSTDGSRGILNEYAGRVVVIDQANAGAAAARNSAARIARGDWLAFIDSDDVWDRDKLEKQAAILRMHPEAIGVYCNKRLTDAAGKVVLPSDGCETYWPSGRIFLPLLISRTVNGFSPSQAVVKRCDYLDVGGFPANQRHAEDWSLWLRLSLRGPILYTIEPLMSYRRHAASVSREGEGDYGRLESRYQTLLAVRDSMMGKPVSEQELDLLEYELFQCSLALGYHSRQRGDKRQALGAYAMAIRLRPLAWRAYLGMTRSLV